MTVEATDQIVENVQKAACLQMLHDRELKLWHESPKVVSVDPERMTPLVRGVPESLKPMGVQLHGQIVSLRNGERAVATLEGAITPDRSHRKRKIWAWGEEAEELMNYGRKYGPVLPSKTDYKALRRANGKHQCP